MQLYSTSAEPRAANEGIYSAGYTTSLMHERAFDSVRVSFTKVRTHVAEVTKASCEELLQLIARFCLFYPYGDRERRDITACMYFRVASFLKNDMAPRDQPPVSCLLAISALDHKAVENVIKLVSLQCSCRCTEYTVQTFFKNDRVSS